MDNPKYDRIREYLNGKRDPKTDEEIREWLCQEPLHDEVEQALRNFWKQLPEESDLPQSRAAFDDFCRNIGSFGEPRRPWAIRWGRRVRNIAAMLLIPAAALCVLLLQRPAASDVEWCEFAVAQGHTDSLTLPDNSRVWLNAGSHLIYPRSFDGRIRKVFLSGEAYFDVAKDAGHPFIIKAGDVQVRVLGTQFNVTSYENMESVSVCLVEGSVSMDIDGDGLKRNILLIPGDVVRYDKISGAVEQRRSPVEAYLSWRNGGFYFNNQPLNEIAAQFERVFNVKIFIADPQAGETPYTLAFVNGESLDRMLEAIAGNDLRINREENMIVIRKK